MTPKHYAPGQGGNPFLTYERKAKRHACLDVSFSKSVPVMDSPVSCTCGWSSTLAQWAGHARRLQVQQAWSDIGPGKRMDWSGPTHRMPATRILGA